MPTPIAEDIITIARLREFLAGCDNRYADSSDIKSYGLSINDHTISLVEGGSGSSVTVPDNNTTYSLISKTEAENSSDTNPRLISGERLYQSMAYFMKNATWNDIAQYGEIILIPQSD